MRDVIEDLLSFRPFRAIVIVMNGASRYEVSFPDLSVMGKDVLTLYHARSDQYDILRLAEISSIEVVGAAV